MSDHPVAKMFLNKYVEIYTDGSQEIIQYAESTEEKRALICGILRNVEKDWATIEVKKGNETVNVMVFLWSVKTIMSPTKKISTMDVFVHEYEAKKNFQKGII